MKLFISFSLILFFLCSPVQAATYERSQLVFGNVLASISIETESPPQKAALMLQAGFDKIKSINKALSTYETNSEISQLNRVQKPIPKYPVSTELMTVIKTGHKISTLSQGYFDITYEMTSSGLKFIKFNQKSLDLLHKDLKINPTGLVKGYCIDQIISAYKKNKNILAATIVLGGDIGHYAKGKQSEAIQIYNPITDQSSTTLNLNNQAVSTAGQYKRGRHIKNTQKSLVEHRQVTVVASTATMSDALSTAMLFMPLDLIKDMKVKFRLERVIVLTQNEGFIEL